MPSREPYEFPSTAAILNWRLAAIAWSDPDKVVRGRTIHDSSGELVGFTLMLQPPPPPASPATPTATSASSA